MKRHTSAVFRFLFRNSKCVFRIIIIIIIICSSSNNSSSNSSNSSEVCAVRRDGCVLDCLWPEWQELHFRLGQALLSSYADLV